MTMNRKEAIKEIEAELGMRRKVWRMNKDGGFTFVEHERRYAKMLSLCDILKSMTDKEFAHFLTRATREVPEQKSFF